MFDDFYDLGDTANVDEYHVISVSDLTKCIRMTLEADGMFADLWVKGEVSNLTKHTNGHIYFSLKDESALIRCVIWAGTARYLKLSIKDGASLIAHGRLSVYEKQGQYQFNIDQVMQQGTGGLYEAYEKLKSKLRDEGLFDNAHKIGLPEYPRTVAMVTSPTGAVIRDMVNIARRRMPSVNLLLIPALVQGDSAPASIAKSIEIADKYSDADVVIIARGGGSLEDLWCFNDELVVRAIYQCETPIVSAVGHETDTTLSDYAADLRAPTPSAAMELILPDRQELMSRIRGMEASIISNMQSMIDRDSSELAAIMDSTSFRYPQRMIEGKWQTLDLLQERLKHSYNKKVMTADSRLADLAGRLNSLSPLNVLSRGYSVLRHSDGSIIKSIDDATVGETTHTLLSNGTVISAVTDLKEGWNTDNGS